MSIKPLKPCFAIFLHNLLKWYLVQCSKVLELIVRLILLNIFILLIVKTQHFKYHILDLHDQKK